MRDAFGVEKAFKPSLIIKPVTESTNPKIVGSSSPAAQRAKALWKAKQDSRTPQARNAWKTGRHINQ